MPSVAQKIIFEKIGREAEAGEEILLPMQFTLTQDATGTMAMLELEALGEAVPRIATELSVSIIDHNTIQTDFRNHDDHEYLRSIAAKYGMHLSRPGNGICHQVMLERFALPGKTIIGSDSHTPTAGGIGALAIGAGGLDVAFAIAGKPFKMTMPKIVGVHLTGSLPEWVSAKDVILEILKIRGKRNKGMIFEYFGEGIAELDVAARATITNMGAELGVTTSIFPSDEVTLRWLEQQHRAEGFIPLEADSPDDFAEILEIDLSSLKPNVACPHQPNNVETVEEVGEIPVNQVIIGSCTNSSFRDLMIAAAILEGKTVHPSVELGIAPGSKQIFDTLARNGALSTLISAGARILESACGPCIGMGFTPGTETTRVCTFNRNFLGRCGEKSAGTYLVSPETAAATAITGVLTSADKLGIDYPEIPEPDLAVNDNMIIMPDPEHEAEVEIKRGPNIKPLPELRPVSDFEVPVLLKCGSDISTDDILMAGSKVLPLRSNIPEISKFCLRPIDPTFYDRAMEAQGGVVIGAQNFGQGSSREHAAIAPLYLGVKAFIAQDIARIFEANCVNWGIVPMTFEDPADYDRIEQGDVIETVDLIAGIQDGRVELVNKTQGYSFYGVISVGEKSREILIAGGLIAKFRQEASQ